MVIKLKLYRELMKWVNQANDACVYFENVHLRSSKTPNTHKTTENITYYYATCAEIKLENFIRIVA